ncbi:hypothetical protein BX600DRAFT_515414 [Xylariales sp. PMI_506]|nr:hypothetical protein BX600DRAFT_515414 [Xylariales sp. PMI_506]
MDVTLHHNVRFDASTYPSMCIAKIQKKSLGKEENFLKEIEELDDNKLITLLQSHQESAFTTGKRLAAAFTGAISMSFFRSHHNDESRENSHVDEDEYSSSCTEIEDHDSISEDDDNDTSDEGDDCDTSEENEGEYDDEYVDGHYYNYSNSSFHNSNEGSLFDEASSIFDEDIRSLVEDFHNLMKEIMEHNSASCLIQFMLNKRTGNEDDVVSLVRAMVPWNFDLDDEVMGDSLVRFPNLSIA